MPYKVVLTGSFGVGKTSFIKQYVTQDYMKKYKAEIDSDSLIKEVMVDGQKVKLQVWDTAGMEKFHSTGNIYFRGADCCVLMYDVTNKKSFEKLETWKGEFILERSPEDETTFPFVVLGTKADNESERKVTKEELQEWCEKNNISIYHEISGKQNEFVDEVFIKIARACLQNPKPMLESVRLVRKPAQKSTCSC